MTRNEYVIVEVIRKLLGTFICAGAIGELFGAPYGFLVYGFFILVGWKYV